MQSFADRTTDLARAVHSLGVALTVIESDDPADAPADKGWTLSIPVRTTCTDCAIPLTDKELVATVRAIGRTVRSEWSRQHGCGAWPELVQRDVWADDVTDDEVLEIARQLAAERDRRAAEIDERRRARLTRELTEFLGADEDERDEMVTSEVEPGVFLEDGEWVSWDFSVLDPTETITVRESDLERAQ